MVFSNADARFMPFKINSAILEEAVLLQFSPSSSICASFVVASSPNAAAKNAEEDVVVVVVVVVVFATISSITALNRVTCIHSVVVVIIIPAIFITLVRRAPKVYVIVEAAHLLVPHFDQLCSIRKLQRRRRLVRINQCG